MLNVENVTMKFGGLSAVSQLNLEIGKNEVVGLIGPNGAGKTTVFNMLTGIYTPTEGEIKYEGKVINGIKPHKISSMGIARTFQNIRLFSNLTVGDNVRISHTNKTDYNLAEAVLRLPRFFKAEAALDEKVHSLLALFNLYEKREEKARNLSYGEQRRLEIVRALATDPKLLLLDEPAAGMNPAETHDLMNLIGRLRDEFDVSILLIEHDMKLVMGICDRINVLNFGKKIASGNPYEIRNNEEVIKAYLGEKGGEGTAKNA
ncbi:ABC transporter ATP-binding protein [Youngiibacter multivorans]|uniref:Branched-chain amino acid transport system ATP-binding protein n=1 Tax=Youngiibacter multivorans TaxID=937251 RepID=A0ABS4G1P1_9CLOT|nr:ABC transporter ATP-binding protein [Youngiibacter multivorans]MBP1918463.1 branched-chain amino acid transport system ATP-binding protein [Youngiibacter multivorans]